MILFSIVFLMFFNIYVSMELYKVDNFLPRLMYIVYLAIGSALLAFNIDAFIMENMVRLVTVIELGIS